MSLELLKVGDRVKDVFNKKGTVITAIGVGYVIKWDKGELEKVQNGCLRKIKDWEVNTNA